MMGIEDGWLTGLFPDDPRPEYYNLPRQMFPPAFHPNGYVDIVTRDWLRRSDAGIFGPRVLGFVTEHVVEVDQPEDFDLLEFQVARRRPALLDLAPPAFRNSRNVGGIDGEFRILAGSGETPAGPVAVSQHPDGAAGSGIVAHSR